MDSNTNKIYPNIEGTIGNHSMNQHQAYNNPGYGSHPITNQPVIQQPLPNTVIINNQPQALNQNSRQWSVSLCDCFANPKHCLCYFFFNPCYAGCQAARMDESCCVGFCLGSAGLLAMRAKLRGKHNIEGGICNDCCVGIFCGPCLQCQTSVEMDRLGYRD